MRITGSRDHSEPSWRLASTCLNLVLSDVSSSDLILIMHFFQEHHRRDIMSFSVHYVRRHILSICLVTDGVNFDHLVKVVSAQLF